MSIKGISRSKVIYVVEPLAIPRSMVGYWGGILASEYSRSRDLGCMIRTLEERA